jgi:hypothetical protein
VRRTRKGSRRRTGLRRVLSNPFTPVLIGLALVLGVGYWAMRETPVTSGDPPPSHAAAGPTGTGDGMDKPAGTLAGATGESKAGTTSGTTDNTPEESPDATSEEASQGTPEAASEATPETTPETTPEGTPDETPAGTSAETTDGAAGESPAPPAGPGDAGLVARGQIDRSGGASETMLITAYFADGLEQGLSLQPVEIKVPFDLARIKVTASHLVNAPQELSLYSSVPPGTQVLETNLKDGVAIVNLSAALEEVRGTAAVNNIRASFVYSLTSIPNVEAVQLWTEGRPAVLDGYEWSRPVTRAEIESEGLYTVHDLIPYTGP